MHLFRIIVAVLMVISLVSACNTVRGIGQDIKKGGQAIERSVN